MRSRLLVGIAVVLSLSVVRAAWADEPAKKPSDADLAKRIVGKWSEEEQLQGGGTSKAMTTYRKDGTFTGEGTITRQGKSLTVKVSGTWKVTDGTLIETVEKCEPALIPKGKIFKDRILSVTDKVLKVKTEKGKEIVKMRVSD